MYYKYDCFKLNKVYMSMFFRSKQRGYIAVCGEWVGRWMEKVGSISVAQVGPDSSYSETKQPKSRAQEDQIWHVGDLGKTGPPLSQ